MLHYRLSLGLVLRDMSTHYWDAWCCRPFPLIVSSLGKYNFVLLLERQRSSHVLLQLCVGILIHVTPALTSTVLIISRGSLIVADSLIIVLTWRRLFPHTAIRKVVLMHRHLSLTEIFIRDGEFLETARILKEAETYF